MHAATRAIAGFEARFGARPAIVARAPGRVNLIGEHLDYNGGDVLPFAIDRDCVVAISASGGGVCRIAALEAGAGAGARPGGGALELPVEVLRRGGKDELMVITGPHHWSSYVLGVAACVGPMLQSEIPAFDMAIASDVPLGGGLSSSASLEVAVARALFALTGTAWPTEAAGLHEVASGCQKAEHEYAGVPCGIMDQLTSASARAGCALRIDCSRRREPEHIPMPGPEEAVVLVIDSGVRHTLATSAFADRVAACGRAARALGLEHLADLGSHAGEGGTEGGWSAMLGRVPPGDRGLVRHVASEQARVGLAAEALRGGDLARVGSLMFASHESLRDDYRVSCEELDTIVEAAMRVPGVHGARMTGGGFGGCAIALVAPGALDAAEREVRGAFTARFGREPRLFVTSASAGAGLVE